MQLSSAQHALAHPEASPWVQRMAKVGYAIKGVVYAITGALALQVALGGGGRLGGEHETVEHVGQQPFGAVLLIVIGVGLLGYALWRLVEGLLDPHRDGATWKGVFGRIAAVGSAVVNGAVAIAALQLAVGEASGGHDAKTWVAAVMREPWGLAFIGGAGALVTGVGIYHVYAGLTDRFTEHLRMSALSSLQRSWALWSGRIGFVARGVVFAIIGVALVRAALTTNPREVKDFKEALQEVATRPFGEALLIAVACGLLAYGIHLVTTAPYRRLVG